MANTVTGNATSQLTGNISTTEGGSLNVTGTFAPNKDFAVTYTSSDVTKLYFNNYSVTSGGTTIDLTNLTDAFGNALSFTTVVDLIIVNNDATNNLTAGGGTNPVIPALPTLAGQAAPTGGGSTGSCAHITTPLSVTGTTKNLQLTASAGTISVDVIIIGK